MAISIPKALELAGIIGGVWAILVVLALLALRLMQLGAGRTFAVVILVIGCLSSAGTAIMTATPFSVSPIVHKTGIGLYFPST